MCGLSSALAFNITAPFAFFSTLSFQVWSPQNFHNLNSKSHCSTLNLHIPLPPSFHSKIYLVFHDPKWFRLCTLLMSSPFRPWLPNNGSDLIAKQHVYDLICDLISVRLLSRVLIRCLNSYLLERFYGDNDSLTKLEKRKEQGTQHLGCDTCFMMPFVLLHNYFPPFLFIEETNQVKKLLLSRMETSLKYTVMFTNQEHLQ